ncbi:DEAD/DEAH box helicase [Streptomyces montanus]|uniref:DEAD/DEAH box helicase n=1 Tax=Streptomyces montanus TaxID=2580423 RepID=A0A5R9G1F4_9ACTN|nr:helicase-related protein [Streptomyces montanus]TLS47328.1 DEAD/DEAH box helicase [Streptomyces montanus]
MPSTSQSTTAAPAQDGHPDFPVGLLVRARGREWVVLPKSTPELLVLRPLGGTDDDIAGVLPALETVEHARFAPPSPSDLGDQSAAGLLRSALRIGFRSSAGPFRSLAGISVEPRPYQLVPLLMALRQETVRLLIADDVGIGKTVESGLIAAELLAQGDAQGLVVLCSPALAEQWRAELRGKFGIDAELVLASTIGRLERSRMYGLSVFRRDRNYVVSTDFIKSPRHRDDFIKNCPDLVIVDEAHTCTADSAQGRGRQQRQQRYALLRTLADDPTRHLLLVTATPHSGKEEPFRNLLGLLDNRLETMILDRGAGRDLLTQHFVQRRRADIRDDFRDDANFPSDRLSAEVDYTLHADYRRLLDEVITYARETVRSADGALQQRIRWWSALALLRALGSSPAAVRRTLRTRAGVQDADSVTEADAIGSRTVTDSADDESAESADAVPGTLLAPGATDPDAESLDEEDKTRLLAMAEAAGALAGPAKDRKLKQLIATVKELLDEGYNPIVFCRFISTAEYVKEHLDSALNKGRKTKAYAVKAVTGELSPDQRVARIAELTEEGEDGEAPLEQRVLVATDCLSEGVNLQESFDAVVHYDLAWNPTRHEQREGRVDRFGQRRDLVKAVTLYGADNAIDGIVLDVLLRKHARIRKATGISVPVPDSSENVMQAVLEGLILRGERPEFEQESLFTVESAVGKQTAELHRAWQSAAERETASRSRYAQNAVKKDEVAQEVAEVRASLGTGEEVRRFTRRALAALRGVPGPLRGDADGFTLNSEALPAALRDAFDTFLGPRHPRPVAFHDAPTAPRGEVALTRTDPVVASVARFVLDAALDDQMPQWQRPARRCGVVRTTAVTKRTTLLLVRYRFQLTLPGRDGVNRQQLAEDARVLAFRGGANAPEWLPEEDAIALLEARAAQNTQREFAQQRIEGILGSLESLMPVLEERGEELAARLLDSHRRVRGAFRDVRGMTGPVRRGLRVDVQGSPDVLGVYHYLPVPVLDSTNGTDETTTNGEAR